LCEVKNGEKIMDREPSQIKTAGDFQKYVLLLSTTATTRPLEEYLRALWELVRQAQAKPVTYALLGQLLHDAFLADPLAFDEAWLQYDAPPDPFEEEEERERAFSVLQHMLCYQIADLYRMAQAGLLENKWRYFGIDSPTGHRWYNFDPAPYLERGAQFLRDGDTHTEARWTDLVRLLWYGQQYE
jgi:hypothetical protein